jgi:hypothetical protein
MPLIAAHEERIKKCLGEEDAMRFLDMLTRLQDLSAPSRDANAKGA